MLRTSVIRSCGLAAIVAGTLRGIASFVPGTTHHVMLLYLFTDVFILFGSIGLYWFQQEEMGLAGTWAFPLMMGGNLVLIGRDVAIFSASLYPFGALMFAAGLDTLAVGSWKAKKFSRWIPILWILSTTVGPIGYFARGLSVLFVISGVLFGFGFAGAGITVLFSGVTLDHT